jgi:cation diffusion facilitator family transporter
MRSASEALSLGILSVGINVVLMVVKITVGLLGHSYALVADGIESGADIVSSLITWAGFQLSLKPADEDHPFGHGRVEALAGLFSGVALVLAAIWIGYHSIHEILTPHHSPAWFTLPVLVVVVCVKEWLSRKVFQVGDPLASSALKAEASHHHADALTSGAAALGISIALLAGPGYEAADDWAALLAAGVILWNAGQVIAQALHDLMDGSVANDWSASIAEVAAATKGVVSTEKCRVRKSGVRFFVELHLQVNPEISVREGHRIGHEVKDRLMTAHPQLADVVVHMEPAEDELLT